MKTCKECHWFVLADGDGRDGRGNPAIVGFCFRNPPQVDAAGRSSRPVVGENDRACGEFQPPLASKVLADKPKRR
jgi:hypothetical protein